MNRDAETEWQLTWLGESAMAYKVETDYGEEVWLPKSQVDIVGRTGIGKQAHFIIPDWLAKDKGIA